LPWTLADFSQLLRIEIPSLVAIVVCWVGARHTQVWDDQLYWVIGSIAAVLVAGVGWGIWLLVGARALRARQRRLAEIVEGLAATPSVSTIRSGQLVSARAMLHFHRPDCPLMAGKRATVGSAEAHAQSGRVACGVCQP
jgi:hypothetical protein